MGFFDDYQLVEIYLLDRHTIFEECEEVLEMECKTRRSVALPVSMQVGRSTSNTITIILTLFN